MKIELDEATVDKLVGKRVAEFNKTIRGLEQKLERRDKKIAKLSRELEIVKGQLMVQDKEQIGNIAKVAQQLVYMMQEANLVASLDEEDDDYEDDSDE